MRTKKPKYNGMRCTYIGEGKQSFPDEVGLSERIRLLEKQVAQLQRNQKLIMSLLK